ncbi:MAG: RagB/SusD family nutrient uptake outer membrane protein [Bacteroidia bacterium]|nr:MAG: RagB/SusD family nutrient uptake outer membrane protein [Bacteroidia bacterium]
MKTTDRYTMRKSLFLIKSLVVVMIMASFNQSCTNLDEELFDSVTPENFFNTEEEILAALGAAYTQFGNYGSGDPFSLQCVSTDEMVVPTRGQDWDDGGEWRRLSLHSYTPEDGYFNGGWNFGFNGVNTANRLIYQFQLLVDEGSMDPTLAAAFIAELRAVRGFFYWQLIDMFGNVPLVTDFENTVATPPTVSRAEVFDWVVTDLEDAVPLLPKEVDGTTYGRMNFYAGKALLAKLYLNAEVYTGTAMWAQAEAACNEVIGGPYNLESNYFANFDAGNTGTAEMIFAIPYDQVYYGSFNMSVRTLHYGSQATFNLTQQPWNGFCTLEEFYNSYEDIDLRKGDVGTETVPQQRRGNFIAGFQHKASGGLVTDDGWEAPNPARQPAPLLGDPDQAPLNFGNMGSGQPQLNELGPQAYRQSGVRIGKWEIALGSDPGAMDNDYAVFRLADILLMKAEALWRQNPGDANILPLVNQVRSRAGVLDLGSVDGPISFDLAGGSVAGGELFNEIGREMFAENHRRQTLIRWGLYTRNADWLPPTYNTQDVLEDGAHTTLFPVHREKIDANPNLVQNPEY